VPDKNSYLESTALGNSLEEIFLSGDIIPGDTVSYSVCKSIFLYHPLGFKMVCGPLQLAMSEGRAVTVPNSPGERVAQVFQQQWEEINADAYIFQTMAMSRVYGISSLALLIDGVAPTEPLDPWSLPDANIAFNIYDPLNTSGSLVLNQQPMSMDFMKVQEISVQGNAFHRSRAITVQNEFPVYIAWNPSAFGFVGRSVYQRAFFPLKSYLKSMITDDMIETKVGVIVAKIKQAGSIANAVMKASAAFKRNVVKEAETGNTINITPEEDVVSLNLQNMDGPHALARRNILENIATAADMPIKILAQEAFVEGFGEGTEDARAVARYVDRVRITTDPLYRFFDKICQYRAWSPAFFESMQQDFPQTYGGMTYREAFYKWSNSFTTEWPSVLEEPESELAQLEDVKLKAVIALIQVFEPILDSSNKLVLYEWAADNIATNKVIFSSPLEFDFEQLSEHLADKEEQEQDIQDAQTEGFQNMGDPDQTGGGAGAGGSVEVPVKMGKADALASRFDKAAAALAKISPDAQDVIPIGKLRDALLNKKRRR
jgi:hypothetical protein